MLSLQEVLMGQFNNTELQQSETVAESINEPVSIEKQNGIGDNNVARIAALSIVAIGILVLPLASLLSSRGHLLPKLPIFVGSRARSVNSDSAILAVDAFGLSIQAKKDSAATREVLEQAAVQHLARLHRTYSQWADTHGDLMGSLRLKLTVDATGKVVSVDSLASHVTNPTFAKTVLDDVQKWRFPKAGVEAAEITVPLLFVPKGMDPDTVVQWERKIRSAQEGEPSAADLRVASKAPISGEGERAPTVLPSAAQVIQPSIVKSSTAHGAKPKKQEVLVVVRTNRTVAIRENPRFSAKTVHEVDEDTQLSIVENQGDWLKVKIADAGFIGFVRKEFVSPLN
jgi:TonB family protein